MLEAIDYTVDKGHYRGQKKPEKPAEKVRIRMSSLKFLASTELSLTRVQETDFGFMQNVIVSESCPELKGITQGTAEMQGNT